MCRCQRGLSCHEPIYPFLVGGEASLKEGEASPEEGGRPRLERGEGEVSTEEGKRRRLEGRGTPGTEGGLDHTETTLHWKNYISNSFQFEWDMMVVTVFFSILNQMEFHLIQNWKENCHHNHIPFNVKVIGNIVFSVQYILPELVMSALGVNFLIFITIGGW